MAFQSHLHRPVEWVEGADALLQWQQQLATLLQRHTANHLRIQPEGVGQGSGHDSGRVQGL